jgi:hypothetical protein
VSSLPNKSLLDTMTQKMVESQVWRSLFRHGYPDTPLNQSLVMMSNVFPFLRVSCDLISPDCGAINGRAFQAHS